MSWNYLPAKERMPAPSAEPPMSAVMHELARKKRIHKLAMSVLGKCLFASANRIEPCDVPIGKVISSLEPLAVRAARQKKAAAKPRDMDLEFL